MIVPIASLHVEKSLLSDRLPIRSAVVRLSGQISHAKRPKMKVTLPLPPPHRNYQGHILVSARQHGLGSENPSGLTAGESEGQGEEAQENKQPELMSRG